MGTPIPIGDEYGTWELPRRRPRRILWPKLARVRGGTGGNVSIWDGFSDESVERHEHLYRSERYGPAPQTKSGFKVVPSGQSGSSEPPSSTAVCLGDRLALVVAQMLAQAKRPGPSPGFPLVQGRQQAINPDHPHLPGINLLKQAIQSPSRAQLVNHIPPTSRSPIVITGSSHQCQSLHKGSHKPLNTIVRG